MVRWEGGKFLVLFKGGGCRVSPRFHLFVFDVNQGNEEAGWMYDLLHSPRDGKTLFTTSGSCYKYSMCFEGGVWEFVEFVIAGWSIVKMKML